MRWLLVVMASWGCFGWGTWSHAEDWPVYLQNLQRNAKTSEHVDATRLQLSWERQLPGSPNPAWPGAARWDAYAGIRGLKSMRNYDPVFHLIAVNDRIWWGSSTDDGIHCVSLTDGQELWTHFSDGPIRMSPAYHGGRIYFGSDDGTAYCLDAAGGKLLWRYTPRPDTRKIMNNGRLISSWPIRTGVIVENGLAYFGASLLPWEPSYLCAVDAVTGELGSEGTFRKEIPEATMEGPLSLVPGRYLVSPQGRVAPRLFQVQDGNPLKQLGGGGGSFVVLTKDSVFHGPGNKTGWLTASSLDSLETVASFRNGNAIVVAGDLSFVLTDTHLSSTNYVTREEIWSVECDYPYALVLADETLFAGGQDKVAAFDAKTGRLLWTHTVRGKAYSLVVANGRLLVSTDTGSLYAFTASKNRVPVSTDADHELADSGTNDEVASRPLAPPSVVADESLRGRFVFQPPQATKRRLQNLATGSATDLKTAIRYESLGDRMAWRLTEQTEPIILSRKIDDPHLPREAFTMAAWVRIDDAREWSVIAACFQDNGDYERGFVFGASERKFGLGVSGTRDGNGFSYAVSDTEVTLGKWYHVAGTYDGATMRVFVDGQLVGKSEAEGGPIAYPTKGVFVLGAYQDDNEQLAMDGAIHELRWYHRALGDAEIKAQYDELANVFAKLVPPAETQGSRLARGPILRFTSPRSASVEFVTAEECDAVLTLRRDGEPDRTWKTPAGSEHKIEIDQLHPQVVYTYTIEHGPLESRVQTVEYECDQMMNFSQERMVDSRPVSFGSEMVSIAAAQKWMVDEVGAGPGVCVCLGVQTGDLIEMLAKNSSWRIIAFDTDSDRVERLRQRLYGRGYYGTRVTTHLVESLNKIPSTGRIANLIVTEQVWSEGANQCSVGADEVARLLVPQGQALLARGEVPCARLVSNGFTTSQDPAGGDDQIRMVGMPIPGAGKWTHLYGTADNSHFGGEQLGGVRTAEDLEVQWIGHPGARYQADRNGRKPAPLAVGGRLFLQGLHRILTLDHYNGTVLWSLEIPELDRYNMPRDCSNWCADEEAVYVAVHGECWKLDARDGRLIAVWDAAERGNEATNRVGIASLGQPGAGARDWGYIARYGDQVIGSATVPGASWSGYWGKDAWYDGTEGPVTDKVCSERLFARDARSGSLQWEYTGGPVINSTIVVADGRVYFVECRSSQLTAEQGRLGGPEFWSNLHLVALNCATGKVEWHRPLEMKAGTVAFYASSGGGRLVLVSSADVQYAVQTVDGATGELGWQASFEWGKGKADHGSHLSRPAIVGDRVYVRPAVFELSSGKQLPLTIPVGGCGTYSATETALFFRSGSGQDSAVWDQQAGRYTKWHRLRPDCWLSTIPAGGMLLSPEGGGGCSCGSWLETSIGFAPRSK